MRRWNMSINSLTNAAIARRLDFLPLNSVPKGIDEIAMAASTITSTSQSPAAQNSTAINTALNVLFGYIPAEVLTLYVAVLTALQGQPGKTTQGEWVVFWVFLVATPLVFWLVNAGKVKAEQKPLPLSFQEWPVWEMFAATIAYCAWAFALPNSPFTYFTWYSSGLAGIAVLIVSTVLGLLAPFFQRPITPK
jgi:hypothetical protein